MNPSDYQSTDKNVTLFGLIALAVSFIAFASTVKVFDVDFDIFTNIFFLNYILTALYFFMIIFENKRREDRYFRFNHFKHNILLLQLFNISAYSLNRSIPVFNISPDWLVGFLLLSNLFLLIYAFRKENVPNWLRHAFVFIANISIIFHTYEAIYVAQIYHITLVSFWFFGISLHTLVPGFLLWSNIKVVRHFLKQSTTFWTTTLVSWTLVIGLLSYMSIRFYTINQTIDQTFHQSNQPYQDQSLPAWVSASQQLPKDWVTKRALKAGLSFATSEVFFSSIDLPNLNERLKHDPLVVIASLFSGGIKINREDRVKILQSLFDVRHETERKLWSGEGLSTSDIVTNIQLFPAHHVAYTEKTFKIKHSQVSHWWSQKEALYTFYLPEGSVVTSAALWINGKEEPAYLTTKSKADSAYTTIVGRERRDPLLLHWQEGNRVTVRVFPCTPKEDRQFKIGVTTPLRQEGDELVYENIDFKGPYWKDATESINVVSEGTLTNMDTPFYFSQKGTSYTYLGPYVSDWSLTFAAKILSETPFFFDGHTYQLQPLHKAKEPFAPSHIYLDVNAAWSKRELQNIWSVIKNKSAFAYVNNRMTAITEDNKSAVFRELRKQNFHLFPFHKMTGDPSIVISKFNQLTPTLSDLKKTDFSQQLSAFFASNKQTTRVFNIGQEITPYLKTLHELRAIQLESGAVETITQLLTQKEFYSVQEHPNIIRNHYGNFQIERSINDKVIPTDAPDHLMRLFAYNDVMRQIGDQYFDKKTLETTLVQQAEQAYVVTPISSLIVLETQEDYDRFDIQKSKNSLNNAAIGNAGSVPEPHEWLLIILVLVTLCYFHIRKQYLS